MSRQTFPLAGRLRRREPVHARRAHRLCDRVGGLSHHGLPRSLHARCDRLFARPSPGFARAWNARTRSGPVRSGQPRPADGRPTTGPDRRLAGRPRPVRGLDPTPTGPVPTPSDRRQRLPGQRPRLPGRCSGRVPCRNHKELHNASRWAIWRVAGSTRAGPPRKEDPALGRSVSGRRRGRRRWCVGPD